MRPDSPLDALALGPRRRVGAAAFSRPPSSASGELAASMRYSIPLVVPPASPRALFCRAHAVSDRPTAGWRAAGCAVSSCRAHVVVRSRRQAPLRGAAQPEARTRNPSHAASTEAQTAAACARPPPAGFIGCGLRSQRLGLLFPCHQALSATGRPPSPHAAFFVALFRAPSLPSDGPPSATAVCSPLLPSPLLHLPLPCLVAVKWCFDASRRPLCCAL